MIPLKETSLSKKSAEELQKAKKANLIGLTLTSLMVIALLFIFFRDNDIPTLVIGICTAYLPLLYVSNLSKINKAIKTK